jgi:hypothetical protein
LSLVLLIGQFIGSIVAPHVGYRDDPDDARTASPGSAPHRSLTPDTVDGTRNRQRNTPLCPAHYAAGRTNRIGT